MPMADIVTFTQFTERRFQRSLRLRYLRAPDGTAYFLAELPRYGRWRGFKDPTAAREWARDEFLRGWREEWRREARKA